MIVSGGEFTSKLLRLLSEIDNLDHYTAHEPNNLDHYTAHDPNNLDHYNAHDPNNN